MESQTVSLQPVREMEGQAGSLSRRNSVRSGAGSRRPSLETESGGDHQTNIFGQMKPLKKSKPVSTVKITFMGKPMVGTRIVLEICLN